VSEEEEIWYQKAYGNKRNIMKLSFKLKLSDI
jgi:hypothetical protein